jgi:hypothetical protein
VAPKNPWATRLPWVLAAGGIAVGAIAGLVMMKASGGREALQPAARTEPKSAPVKVTPPIEQPPPPAAPAPAAAAAVLPPPPAATPAKVVARQPRPPVQVDASGKRRTASRALAPKSEPKPPATSATAEAPAEKAADPAPKPAEADPPSQSPLDGFANPFR